MNTGTIKTSIKETSKFNWGTVQHLMITPLTVCFWAVRTLVCQKPCSWYCDNTSDVQHRLVCLFSAFLVSILLNQKQFSMRSEQKKANCWQNVHETHPLWQHKRGRSSKKTATKPETDKRRPCWRATSDDHFTEQKSKTTVSQWK